MSEPQCRVCDSTGWTCENRPDLPWDGTSNRADACGCGAGAPCAVCQPETYHAGLVWSIAQEAKRYAAFCPAGRDGRNTFEMFADFVETRSIAQAIEARRAETGTHPIAVAPGLLEAARSMAADFQTSETHHPDYVLVPLAAFIVMRTALTKSEAA